MELGIYHEFPVLPGRSQAECFAAGFDIVDASEEYGLDVMWLAELHFDKRRALAASPLVLAWERVRANRGASGADRVTIGDFEVNLDRNLERLHRELREQTYQPQAVRRLE